MVSVLFEVLVQGLRLWNAKESTKYLDEVLELQKDWMKEYSKERSQRNNSKLDEIEVDLQRISKIFTQIGVNK